MSKTTGFLEYERVDAPVVPEKERIKNFSEFHGRLKPEEQLKQADRCMNCGIPFCQAGMMIAGMASGCPLNNLVPELNELVSGGNYELAYKRLQITHSFPEFTSRVCPALCEKACTCGLHQEPVSTKENEKAVIEYAFENDLVKEVTPSQRTGKKVAVVGSGPSGLAAAQLLNRRGHLVTVYERSDRIGGLLRYGIPNMKLDKSVIDRRVKLMEDAGVTFKTCVNVCGNDEKASHFADKQEYISAEELKNEYDAVVLACGASNPRDIKVPGREAEGIYFAVDFLGRVTKTLLDGKLGGGKSAVEKAVKGKDVIVIGGGDTGNDCVGTSIRLGAASVTQLEMMPAPPVSRTDKNPWPEWPKVLKTDYGQEEAIYKFGEDPRVYQTTVKEFISKNGKLTEAVLVSLESKRDEKTGRMSMVPVEGTERTVKAGLVLIAAGFLGSEAYVTEGFGVETDQRTNVKTAKDGFAAIIKAEEVAKDSNSGIFTTEDSKSGIKMTEASKTGIKITDNLKFGSNTAENTKAKIYTAGDMHRGQSLVVWAIAEGRRAAREVDRDLMGYTNL